MTTTESIRKVAQVLIVAGSDSVAGAGIQANLKVYAARGVYCASVITAVTAQNTRGIQSVYLLPSQSVSEQLKSVLSDFEFDVVKTGMLPLPEIVEVLQNLSDFPVRGRNQNTSLVLFSDLSLCIEEMRSAAKLLHEMGPRFPFSLIPLVITLLVLFSRHMTLKRAPKASSLLFSSAGPANYQRFSYVLSYVVRITKDFIKKQPKTLIVVGSYSIGKECVYLAIAKALGVYLQEKSIG